VGGKGINFEINLSHFEKKEKCQMNGKDVVDVMAKEFVVV